MTDSPKILKPIYELLFALLVSNCAGCLASRLAGSLALAAAALSSSLLKVSLIDSFNVLHRKNLQITNIFIIISHYSANFNSHFNDFYILIVNGIFYDN